jgi:hypothetical protein
VFEQLNKPEETMRISVAMTLGILAAYLIGAFGGLCLFLFLEDRPFGTQIATVMAYTYFVFWFTFFPTRGMPEQYRLQSKTVQRQIPRLLTIHCACLTLIVIEQTILFAARPRLPSYWLTEHKDPRGTLYDWVLMASCGVIFYSQVLFSRRILSRSVKEDSCGPPSYAQK